MQDISHAGRLGNILTLNGNFRQDFPVLSGQRLRLRLINAANARVMGISFDGHDPLVVALDGQPLTGRLLLPATPFFLRSRGGNDFVRHVLLQEPHVRPYQTPRPRGGA